MPSPAGLAERLRRPPRPHGRQLPLRALRAPTCPTSGATCPGPWCSRRRGTPRPAGCSCRTCWSCGPSRTAPGDPTTAVPPATSAATGTLLRLATCIEGHVEVVVNVVPVFEYGVQTGHVGLRRGRLRDHDGPPAGRRPGAHPDARASASARPAPAATGARRSTRARRAFVALSWSGGQPDEPGRGAGAARRHRQLLAGLALQRHLPRPPVAQLHGAQRADAQGPELRTHRRHHGGVDDLAARDARRGAQLGLPLHLDPRLVVHAALALPARVRLGGARVLRLRARGGGAREPANFEAPDHVRHRRPEGPDRDAPSTICRAGATRGRCGWATAPGTSTRTTCGGCSSTPSTSTSGRARRRSSSRSGRAWPSWSSPPSRTRATPTRASGRSGVTRSTSRPPRCCAGWPWTAVPTWPGPARTTTGPSSGARRPTS